jgi:DNA-binding transcriptional MerR regulator
MGVLDQVMQMRGAGRNDSEIIRYLQSQGVPPKEIQDALSQAQIKSAVYGEEMQQSIMDYPSSDQGGYQEIYTPQAPPQPDQFQQPYPATPSYQQYQNQNAPQNYQQETYYPQEQQEYYQPEQMQYVSAASDTSTLIEVAEQVFSDKIKKIEKPLDSLSEFKNLAETRLKIMEERLQRIESVIDNLQISILEKIGSYGSNLSSIKKEMEMMQSSFSKAINPLMDRNLRK